MNYPKQNQAIFALKPWDTFSTFKVLSPKENWPSPKKGEYHPASSLDMKFFEWKSLPEADVHKFKEFITSFKPPKLKEYSMHIEIQKALSDILRFNQYVHSRPLSDGKVTEAEVRFVVIDPIIKALLELTGCETGLEDPVREEEYINSDISDRSVVDYTVYYLGTKAVKILILEAKTNSSLNDKAVCQVVGYFMATAKQVPIPLLGVVMTQSKVQFLFFPYMTGTSLCADCVVSPLISIIPNLESVMGLMVCYLNAETEPTTISETELQLHRKDSYKVLPDTVIVKSEVEKLNEEIMRKDEEMMKEMRKKDEEIMKKDEEIKKLKKLTEPLAKKMRTH